jgi:hypothetical protein
MNRYVKNFTLNGLYSIYLLRESILENQVSFLSRVQSIFPSAFIDFIPLLFPDSSDVCYSYWETTLLLLLLLLLLAIHLINVSVTSPLTYLKAKLISLSLILITEDEVDSFLECSTE